MAALPDWPITGFYVQQYKKKCSDLWKREKGKKGRKITKRLQGPVSLLLVLDEKHKRYPRGSAMQQADVLWHLKGGQIESGRAGKKITKLLYEWKKLGKSWLGHHFLPTSLSHAWDWPNDHNVSWSQSLHFINHLPPLCCGYSFYTEFYFYIW